MKRLHYFPAAFLATAMLGALVALPACSDDDDGPRGPRYHSESDSLALVRIIEAMPMKEGAKWNPSNIMVLPKGISVTWTSDGAGSSNITELSIQASGDDYREGTLSEAIGEIKTLTRLCLSGEKLTGPLPESISGLTALKQFQLSNSGVTRLPERMPLAGMEHFAISRNELITALPYNIDELGKDVTDDITVYITDNPVLAGKLPSVRPNNDRRYNLYFNSNAFNSIDMDYVGIFPYGESRKSFLGMSNKIKMELSESVLTDTVRLYRAYRQLYPQEKGFGFTNMPSEEEIFKMVAEYIANHPGTEL